MVFLDNAGIILAGFFRPITTGAKTVFGLKREDGGASFGTGVYHTSTNNILFNVQPNANNTQIGESSTPVTRQDFKIGSPFSVSPESASFTGLNGGYNSGLGKIEIPATLASTGGSGIIKEVIKRALIRDAIGGTNNRQLLFLRDVVNDTSFLNGESININHEVLI